MKNTPEGDRSIECEKSKIEEMVSRLSHYLYDYSEEIPQERVTGNHNYKVSGSWFQGAISNMKYVVHFMLDDLSLRQEVETFASQIITRRHDGLEAMRRGEKPDSFVPTTKEEIEQANTLLIKVIKNLQNST